MKSLAVLLPYLLILWLEVRPLLQRKRRSEAMAVGTISVLGAIYAVGLLQEWPLPNPAAIIEAIFLPLGRWAGLL